jgi:hypothetical protein
LLPATTLDNSVTSLSLSSYYPARDQFKSASLSLLKASAPSQSFTINKSITSPYPHQSPLNMQFSQFTAKITSAIGNTQITTSIITMAVPP